MDWTDSDGVYIMKDKKIVDKISTSEGLAGNVVFKIMQDKENNFWISTGTGISYYESKQDITSLKSSNKKIFNFTSEQGLGTDAIFQVIIDYTNTVWFISNKGISSVPLEDMKKVYKGESQKVDAKFYNKNDGLRSKGANPTALSALDRNECLWFTMVDGFAIYNPVKNQNSIVHPILHIESLIVDDEHITPKDNTITLPAGAKRLDIPDAGLSFVSPEQLRFSYMLEGFDKVYSPPTAQRSVSYTNLPLGKYTFNLRVKTVNGDWTKEPISLFVVQDSFYYQIVTFWIIVAILLIIVIFAIYYMRELQNKKIQRQLELKVQERTHELQIERDKSDSLLKIFYQFQL